MEVVTRNGLKPSPYAIFFFAKLELLEGLFIDLLLEGKRVKLNPRFILKIESSAS